MTSASRKGKRWLAAPVMSGLLIAVAVAAVNAVKPENMIATDGAIEVVDGKHIQELTRAMPLASGETVSVMSGNGYITVEGWDQPELHITATKRMERRVGGLGWIMNKLNIDFETSEDVEAYFEEVDVEVREVSNGIEIETVKPAKSPNVNVSIHYDIKVPRNTNLNLKTSNGRVDVKAIDGAVVGRSSNGRVEFADITGSAEAHTSNGSISCVNVNGAAIADTSNGSVTVERSETLGADDTITCETSNGSIRLQLPETSVFDIRARTSNGRIRSDFTVDTSDGKDTKRSLEGFVGNGGPMIDLKTSNGSISINSF